MAIPQYDPKNYPPMPIHEHPKHWILNLDGDENSILQQAAHGDLLIDPTVHYRTEGVHFVCKYYDGNKTICTTKDRADLSAAAYYSVPLTVTRHIPDPLAFYLGYLENKKYQIRLRDYHGIELDAAIHQTCLQKYSGGRPIDFQRKVYYELTEYWGVVGLYLKPDDNLDECEAEWLRLTPKLAAKHLQAPLPTQSRNPAVMKRAAEYKKKYETTFLQYLQSLPKGASLNVQSPLPKEPKDEKGGCSVISFEFNRLENNVLYMNQSLWDDNGKEISQIRTFKQKVATQYGWFAGVPFWTDGDEFIPLPYNL
ncbi:MAG: hypothetical protein RLZZ628_2546 [Bacteroidota bacterium]|jgi:hypothetical protein